MSRSHGRRLPLDPLQRLSAVAVVVGLIVLFATWTGGGADAAADNRDQITGSGISESALTVKWADGLLGKDNKTIVAPRSQGNLNAAFYNGTYNEFKNIQVTVSQTENLVHQSVVVNWTGASPTPALGDSNFFQIMECYGDADSGPAPEGCEYGADGLYTGVAAETGISGRGGSVCTASSDPRDCDPLESDPTHRDPGIDPSIPLYTVPFVATGTTNRLYDSDPNNLLSTYFDLYSSNEVQQARTEADGTGTQYFQTLTATQAPGLGCGVINPATGQPHDCWLEIVPRGDYRPSGYQINNGTGFVEYLDDSPLGASNWAQRIQIHLGYAPLQTSCPIGSAKERQTVGTQLAADAVFSWQLALNQQSKCASLYGYTATPEATQTTQLAAGTVQGAAGLAFTTIPIGSEGGRESGDATTTPTDIDYAPVAVSALTISFRVNIGASDRLTPVKLTPRLMAKALTQSYLTDLPGFLPNNPAVSQVPAWAAHNPAQITADPEFQALNPDIPPSAGAHGLPAPMLGEDHSALNEQVWEWVLSDQKARDWLNGTPDEFGMAINPVYSALHLADNAIDSFPRADPTCFDTKEGTPTRPSVRCSVDLLPYVLDFADAASHMRSGNDPEGTSWSTTKAGADGLPGAWGAGTLEGPGQTFLWGVTDSANTATFGLVGAALCDGNGQNCVAPSDASVTAGIAAGKADSAGLIQVDPAQVPAGAYPLVDVTYAAVRTDDDPAAISDYASLISYASSQGQTPGEAPGELPRGYLPLPANLQTQAAATVTALRATATASQQSSSTSSSQLGDAGAGASGDIEANDSGDGGVDARATSSPPAASSPSAGPAAVIPPTATPVASITPAQHSSMTRYAPVLVIITGLAGLVTSRLLRVIGRRRG